MDRAPNMRDGRRDIERLITLAAARNGPMAREAALVLSHLLVLCERTIGDDVRSMQAHQHIEYGERLTRALAVLMPRE